MNDNLEYLFYSSSMYEKFIQTLNEKSIPWKNAEETIHNSFLIQISEQDIEPYWDEVDDHYDELALEDQKLVESGADCAKDINAAGIHIQLSDNSNTIAQVNPDVINRILDVITADEFSEFIDKIVKSVEHPDDTPLCKTSGIAS